MANPIITNDIVLFGILAGLLALIFYTSSLSHPFWRKFYAIVPALFLAYMLPAVLRATGLIGEHWTLTENGQSIVVHSRLYYIATRAFLPAALILLTLSIDLKAIMQLGWKALLMFFTGTIGIIIGGPTALYLSSRLFPSLLQAEGHDATWRGLATLAGSWIGGGANQTAMLEIFGYNKELYGGMLLTDIVVANIWMALLLFGIKYNDRINRWLHADTSDIDRLVEKSEQFRRQNERIPQLRDYMIMLGVTFAAVSASHLLATGMSQWLKAHFEAVADPKSFFSSLGSHFFWLITFATAFGITFSYTALRRYEGAGASKIGSVFIYFLVAVIGMKIDIFKIFEFPELILLGLIWMSIHALLLIAVAKWSRSPYFFLAVGSQANVGGAASAPIVAAAFHPALASVGALLAILGYVVGTYGAMLSAWLMAWITEILK
ncbi:MAG: DUF819 family protein [Chlorobi bacterium]|nr:DUF819 family protein [Chlorobiota bacterium]